MELIIPLIIIAMIWAIFGKAGKAAAPEGVKAVKIYNGKSKHELAVQVQEDKVSPESYKVADDLCK